MLEVYHKKVPKFIYGSPTSTETSNQDEEAEARPNGTAQVEEIQIEKPQELRKGGQEEREVTNNLGTNIGGDYSRTKGRAIKDAVLGSKTIDQIS